MEASVARSHLPPSHVEDHVKEEDETHTSRYSDLPALNTSLPPRYDSPVNDAPPPPPAAYADPSTQDSSAESGGREGNKRPHSYIDDPIPPPPAKYSVPAQILPPISEITRQQESGYRPTRHDEVPHSYRRYSNDTQSADRYTQSREYESQRGPMRTPYTSTAAPRTPSLDEQRRRSFSSDSRPMYQVSAPSEPQGPSHYDQYRSGYANRAADPYYRPHSPRPAYLQHASSRDLMPPPPGPATGSTIYTPSLSHPHTPQSNGTYHPYQVPVSRDESMKSRKPIYGAEVKRHLDSFDLEQALNTMSQSSRELLDFGDYYRQKAHTTQRTGPLPGTIPHLQQLDDMMKHSEGVRESLSRLREIVVSQRQAEEEASRVKATKIIPEAPPMLEQQHEPVDTRGDGGFAGADGKKRRGRAAPPGKCHSCNRVDTPEWRRGPDGARTLCNACGLHYAKLTRKSGTANRTGKVQQGSNLRPKDDTEHD